jgi:hypothetical protein
MKMQSKKLTQSQFNLKEGTVYSVNIPSDDFDTNDMVDYLEAKCQGWFMPCYTTEHPNQFLFEKQKDIKHYKAWAGWKTFQKMI